MSEYFLCNEFMQFTKSMVKRSDFDLILNSKDILCLNVYALSFYHDNTSQIHNEKHLYSNLYIYVISILYNILKHFA